MQNIYHRAKFEFSSLSSLANTVQCLKGFPLVLEGTKSPGGIGLIYMSSIK